MSGKIFLLIDDDADDRELFCEALQQIDPALICYTAANGRMALDLLANGQMEVPHIIFLDLNMPKLNGWKCLTLLRDQVQYKNIPVILYSTASTGNELHQSERSDFLFFYTKPSDFQCLKKDLTLVVKHLINDTLNLLWPQMPF